MKGISLLDQSPKSKPEPAGAPSGYIQRFELEKYNPKIMKTPSKSRGTLARPYTTQNAMRRHRVLKERESCQEKMDELEKSNPYWIDGPVYAKEKPKVKKPRPQTVKLRRVQNGLKAEKDSINKNHDSPSYCLPLTCKHNFGF